MGCDGEGAGWVLRREFREATLGPSGAARKHRQGFGGVLFRGDKTEPFEELSASEAATEIHGTWRDGDSRDIVGRGAEGLACTSLGWSSGFQRRGAGDVSSPQGLEETNSQRQGWEERPAPVLDSSGLISAAVVKSPVTPGSACGRAGVWRLWTRLVSSLAHVWAGASSSRGTGMCWPRFPAAAQNTSPESSAGAGGSCEFTYSPKTRGFGLKST